MHIFESRYQEMLTHCLEHPGEAGDFIVLFEDPPSPSEGSGVARAIATDIGCVVSVISVLNENDDGTRDILVRGIRRVRVLERLELHAYTSAKVETYFDRADVETPEETAVQLYAMHRQLILRTQGDEPPNSFYEREGSLAFLVAACSGMDIEPRLALMKADSEAERQILVIAHLKDLLPAVSQIFPVIQHALGGYTLIRQLDQAISNSGS